MRWEKKEDFEEEGVWIWLGRRWGGSAWVDEEENWDERGNKYEKEDDKGV